MKVRVSGVQMQLGRDDFEEFYRRMKFYVDRASTLGADIVAFPEYYLSGLPNFDDIDRYKKDYLDMKRIQRLAERNEVFLVPGSYVQYRDGDFYNTLPLISDEGEIIGEYSKVCLWHTEKDYLQPGDGVKVFDTKLGNLGLSICWDLAYPEVYRDLRDKGAEIVFISSAWANEDKYDPKKIEDISRSEIPSDRETETNFIDSCVRARSTENGFYVVFANGGAVYYPEEVKKHGSGCSQVVSPFFGAIERMSPYVEGLFVADLDLSLLEIHEKTYDI